MSYMVARMQKMKAGNLGGAYKHNERVFETHSNKDIDPSRSPLNYELTDRDHSVSYEKQIKDYVNENKISNRAIRKDAVLCDEWIITSDKSFFDLFVFLLRVSTLYPCAFQPLRTASA